MRHLLAVVVGAAAIAGADAHAKRYPFGNTCFHAAAFKGPEAIEACDAEGADPNTANDDGYLPLHYTAREGFPEAVAALLKAWANPNATGRHGWTALHHAAHHDHHDAMRELLEARADPNLSNNRGRTPLHLAIIATASTGRTETIATLLRFGADPNASEGGWTPLHFAARDGHVNAIPVLLEAGAKPDVPTPDFGATPLHVVARSMEGRRRPEAISLLVAAGADPETRDADGRTPLLLAANSPFPDAVRALLSADVDPNARDRNGWTPLLLAAARTTASKEDAEVITALLAAGADPNVSDRRGKTPLDHAREDRHVDAIAALLAAGATLQCS